MTNRFINPRPQFLDNSGKPLKNGKMNFYENGTLIRKDTFTDVNEDNKNANPVPLNADGTLPNVFYAGTSRIILTFDKGSGEEQRFDVDGVGIFGSGAAFDIFNSITEYELGALAEASDGEYYRSLQNNNTGNDPVSSPSFWEQVNFIRTYNVNVTYGSDAIVIANNGLIFRSLQAGNLNNDPLTSPLFWGTPVAFVDVNMIGDLSFSATELTISAGSVDALTSHHTIDTEADAASDDLDTITVAGVADFTVLYLRLENAARVVTLKDNAGNIQTKNNEDIILDASFPTILFRVGTDWFEIQRPVVDNPFNQSLNTTDSPSFVDLTLDNPLVIAEGGTGAGTTNDARNNLGVTFSVDTIALMVAETGLVAGDTVITWDIDRFETWGIDVTGDVLLDNGLFATRTQSRIYTTLAAIKADQTLKNNEKIISFLSGDERPRNGRAMYRIQTLAAPVSETRPVDDEDIILLTNGLYAVAVQSVSDIVVPFTLYHTQMHFQALKGTPFTTGEVGGAGFISLTVAASVGDDSITVDAVGVLVIAGQLICYRADDGEYYSTVADTIVSNVINLRTPIEAASAIGSKVFNFYNNLSHANRFGFYTIADYALRDLTYQKTKVSEFKADDWIKVLGPETIATSVVEDIHSPGSASNPYVTVTTTAANEGITLKGELNLPQGAYLIRALINPGTTVGGSARNNISLTVGETPKESGISVTPATMNRIGKDTTQVYELIYYARTNSTQNISIRSFAAAGEFEVGKVEIFKVESLLQGVDTGKHVFFGDSWIALGDILDRFRDRLPNAEIIDEGVGGDTAADLDARFDADVPPHKPDFVWLMAGTNDYFNDVTLDTFEFNMNRVKTKITGIGATPLAFDSSVGQLSDPNNFNLSRTYAIQGSYSIEGDPVIIRSAQYDAVLTPGAGTITLNGAGDTLYRTIDGDRCTVSGQINVTSISGISGTLRLNLPIPAANMSDQLEVFGGTVGYINVGALTGPGALTIRGIEGGGSEVKIVELTTTGFNDTVADNILSNSVLWFNFSYILE